MSIFPKRTIPGKGITIHWNFNTVHLKASHVFPFVRIGVKAPDGKIQMLLEQHMLALPDPESQGSENIPEEPGYKYLNKNTPLLVLADYLGGGQKREKLAEILQGIQSGRHFYFYYPLPADAVPGKYELLSEVHSNGELRHSKTRADDYFFVEKLQLKTVRKQGEYFAAEIQNLSPEPVPVKLVECIKEKQLKTKVQVFEIPSYQDMKVSFSSMKTFLFYNEEREVIPLVEGPGIFSLRNQQLLSVEKKENAQEVIYVMPKDSEVTFKLEGVSRDTWLMADGLTTREGMEKEGLQKQIYEEMVQSGLLEEIRFLK